MPEDPTPQPLRLAWSHARQAEALATAGDAELLAAVREGGREAFEVLVERATPDLVRWAGRYLGDIDEARDVVQTAFLQVWRRRRRYDPAQGNGRSWLLAIVTHLAIDRLRQQQRRRRLHRELGAQPPPAGPAWADRGSAREVERLFQTLAEDLTPRQRAAFLLREVEERDTAEVAEILGCDPSTVRSLLAQARTVLRRELLRRYPEYAPAAARRLEETR